MKDLILKVSLPIILGIVEDMITPENFKIYGKKLIQLAREFVLDTETKVDDKIAIPLLDAAERAIGVAHAPSDD